MSESNLKSPHANLQFLKEGGEMGELTRQKDWSKTSLGSPESWPQSLRTSISIVLNSRFPMVLLWGPKLICFYNDAFRPSLGQNGKHPFILGMNSEDAWSEIWDIIQPLLLQVTSGGGATWSEDQLIPIFRNNNIEDVYWTFSYSPIHDDGGNVSGVLVICNETTDKIKNEQELITFSNSLELQVRQRTAELEQKNIDLEKINRELQSFAYISSHDLQEPLRKIQTFSSRIQEKEFHLLTETGKDSFKRIQNAANRMQALIDDLLTYSRTKTGERKFETVHLQHIVDDVTEDLKEEIEKKKAIIEVEDLCEVDVIPFQFRQLMYNLISNSLKFSRDNHPPRIQIKSNHQNPIATGNGLSHPPAYHHISITDNGIGFEPQYQNKIFEVFQRLHGKTEYAGTGIGLAIVKKIVENHNGHISATGELHKGATFDIYIPSVKIIQPY
ncbi:MAG: ATP-binding protein [Saprospiraceae bacterium]